MRKQSKTTHSKINRSCECHEQHCDRERERRHTTKALEAAARLALVVEDAAEARDHRAKLVLNFSVQRGDHGSERVLAAYRRYLAVFRKNESEAKS